MSSTIGQTEEELLTKLGEICEQLGWVVAVPTSTEADNEIVEGLVIGTPNFVEELLGDFENIGGGKNVSH